MITELKNLREEVTHLKSIVQENTVALQEKAVTIESQSIEIGRLEMELRLLRQKMYGPKSERMVVVDPEIQTYLFNEAEATKKEDEIAEEIQVIQYERKRGGRRALPDNLQRIDQVHDIAEEEKVCGCGRMLNCIGEEVTEELDIVPRQCRVIRHIRLKYACRECEGVESDKGAVQIAPAPVQLLPKTIATAGLIASVVVEKFADGLPLYRQAARFSREGIEISRGTLSNWVVRVGELCNPLMEIFREDLRAGAVINADETPVQVLKEPGRANTTKSYMWVFRGGRPPDRGGGVILFDYRPTRSGEEILKEYLTGYTGFVQTDGYIGYEVLSELSVRHAGCWAHVRRKFVEVVQAVDKARKGKARSGCSGDVAVSKIRRLYDIESEGKKRELTGAKLIEFRREHALPVLEKFHSWLKARMGTTPPKGLLGTAMNYTLKQWNRLVVYVDDPYVGLDNNPAENAIRPFAVGRKNWLFAGSPAGARASANLYSLVETAKANDLEPYRYLRFLFERLPYAKTPEDYRKLTPLHIDRNDFDASLPQWG